MVMLLALQSTSYGVYISQLIQFARASSHVADRSFFLYFFNWEGADIQPQIRPRKIPDS